METCLLHLQHGSGFVPFPLTPRRQPWPLPIMLKSKPFTTAARTESTVAGACRRTPQPAKPDAGVTAMLEKKTKHDDSWFDLLAINYLTSILRATSGRMKRKEERGYDGLVEAAAVISSRHEAIEQQSIVTEALNKAFPPAIFSMASSLSIHTS
ncbi:hypothetical protein KSP40_PGU022601 [Platanthera guangdongensis]|uniref:Uncharacterized protein n=1 Tax=Platanthera guangdongensis TaxID=2320717 RepID=A0ABR2LNC7_9ASPA